MVTPPTRTVAAPDGRRLAVLRVVIPVTLAVLATLGYGLMGVQQLRNLVAPSWDLGIFAELAKAYAELRVPIVPIKGDGVNLLGDHFHPILVLLGPIWRVWPSPLSLLWTQAALFGLSAIPIARLAIDRLGVLTGTVVGASYVFSFGLQAAAVVQFHEIAFAVPLLAFSLTALLRGRVVATLAWAAPLVLVKEDLGLTVAVLGLVMVLRFREQRWAGWSLIGWGLVSFAVSTFVILPAMNTQGHYDYAEKLGSLLDVFLPGQKWLVVASLLLAAGVIGARSPVIWLMLPTLAWRFTGTVATYWDWWYWHYNAVLMPVATVALLDALGDRRTGESTFLLRSDRPMPGRRVRALAVAASVAVTAAMFFFPSSIPLLTVFKPSAWVPPARAASAETAMAAIPPGSIVASDITLLARLVPDHDVQWTHGPNTRIADCVLIDAQSFSWNGSPPDSAAQWAADHFGTPYEGILDDGGFQIACRPGVA